MSAEPPQQLLCFPASNASCVRPRSGAGPDAALGVLFGAAALLTVLGNSVVIASVGRFKQLCGPTHVLVASLAVVDLLVGLTVMPLSGVRTVSGCWFFGDELCRLHSSVDVFLTTLSIFHLICIAVDRHQAVCRPLHYCSSVTPSVAWMMVCGSWTAAALYSYGLVYSRANVSGLEDYLQSRKCLGSCSVVFNVAWGTVDSVICFFLPCAAMLCLYAPVLSAAREHVRRMGGASGERGGGGGWVKQHKAAQTLGVVLGAFVVCWTPFFVDSLVDACAGFVTPAAVADAFVWLGYFNSALNPVIYAAFRKRLNV